MTRPFEITLLTQTSCGYCDHAKAVLRRVAEDYPLHVTEIDLATPEGQKLAEGAGLMFAPGVLLDGEGYSYGRLSERKLRRTLASRGTTEDLRERTRRPPEGER